MYFLEKREEKKQIFHIYFLESRQLQSWIWICSPADTKYISTYPSLAQQDILSVIIHFKYFLLFCPSISLPIIQTYGNLFEPLPTRFLFKITIIRGEHKILIRFKHFGTTLNMLDAQLIGMYINRQINYFRRNHSWHFVKRFNINHVMVATSDLQQHTRGIWNTK